MHACTLLEASAALLPSYCRPAAILLPADDETAITFARKLGGFTVSWPLGAQIKFAAEERCQVHVHACMHACMHSKFAAEERCQVHVHACMHACMHALQVCSGRVLPRDARRPPDQRP